MGEVRSQDSIPMQLRLIKRVWLSSITDQTVMDSIFHEKVSGRWPSIVFKCM